MLVQERLGGLILLAGGGSMRIGDSITATIGGSGNIKRKVRF